MREVAALRALATPVVPSHARVERGAQQRERSITGLGRARYGRAREGIRLSYHISHLVSVARALCRSLTHTSPSL